MAAIGFLHTWMLLQVDMMVLPTIFKISIIIKSLPQVLMELLICNGWKAAIPALCKIERMSRGNVSDLALS